VTEAQFDTKRTESGETVVVASGEIDIATAPDFSRALDAALAARPAVLVIDLAMVEFIDSSGLNAMLQANHASGDDVRLVLQSPSDACRRVLKATGLDDVLEIRE
jgi:anti-sigma B factor antagonist